MSRDHGLSAVFRLQERPDLKIDFWAGPIHPSWANILRLHNAAPVAGRYWVQHWYSSAIRQLANPFPPQKTLPEFSHVPIANRPYALGAFLNLRVGDTFPALDLARSDVDGGRLVYFVNGPLNIADWQPQMPRIASWLGGGWVIENTDATAITLVRRNPLPASFSFRQAMLKAGHIFAGINTTTHRPVHVPIADLPSGTLVVGAAGSGKSNGLHVLLRSVFSNLRMFDAVYLADGKLGEAFARYRDRHPKVKVLWEPEDLWALTERLVEQRKERNRHQTERGIDNARSGFIALVIDEMAVYTQKPSVDSKNPLNKQHLKFIDDLSQLALFGRSTGFRLIISAQQPVADHVPMSVKANCNTTIAFRLPTDQHVTSLFGQIDQLPVDPRKLTQGHALIHHGLAGTFDPVQFPVIAKAGTSR